MIADGPALVVAAHPDDEVLGCGGTIVRLARAGRPVHVAILGEGVTSRYDAPGDADPALLESLHRRCGEVADRLGATGHSLHGFPDNRFDTVPLLDVVKVVERLVERVRPAVVLTHHGGDLNVDHAVTHRAVLTATRPVPGAPVVRQVLLFEVMSSTEWAFDELGRFSPNLFVDIEQALEEKIAAMEAYESERRAFPHPRSPEAIRAVARRWGSVAGCAAAEAFRQVRALA
jgi:LmbE family N-acetylglucosaminyl deacetylase